MSHINLVKWPNSDQESLVAQSIERPTNIWEVKGSTSCRGLRFFRCPMLGTNQHFVFINETFLGRTGTNYIPIWFLISPSSRCNKITFFFLGEISMFNYFTKIPNIFSKINPTCLPFAVLDDIILSV